MDVLIPALRTNTGSDLYCRDLQQALEGSSVTVDIAWITPCVEFLPLFATSAVRQQFKKKHFNLVHSNADYGTMFKIARTPLIVTAHHNVFDEAYQRATGPTQKIYHYGILKRRIAEALRNADRIVAVSHSTKKSLERTFGVTGIDVIHNGVDTAMFRPMQIPVRPEFRQKTRLLFVGSLTKRKGADLLPKIMERLGDKYVLFYTADRPGGNFSLPNTIPLGRVSRESLAEIYNMADLFLFPSRLEGFGYAVAEAMACGKPVVCTDCSSLPELTVNGKGGFLCVPDDIEDFVRHIELLGSDAQLRERMGEFNRQRTLDHFTRGKMRDAYLHLYEDFVESAQ